MEELKRHIEQIKALCDTNKVISLFAFGSVTTDGFSPESDIDLIVDIEENDPLTYSDNYFNLKFALEQLLKREIDLLEQKAIKNPYLKQQIEKTKVQVYGKSNQDLAVWYKTGNWWNQSFHAWKKRFFEFRNDLKTRRAIERNVEIIGEAVSRILKVDPNIQIKNSRKIVDTRNRIIHGYDNVSEEIIWSIVIRDLPKLEIEVNDLLEDTE